MEEKEVTKSLEHQRMEMAAILGLDEPVSEEVLLAAVADSTYAHNLLVSREEPIFLNQLLAHPPPTQPIKDPTAFGTAVLVHRAAQSILRWAKTGFSTVSNRVYNKRLSACSQCPNHIMPPEQQLTIYKLAGAKANEKTVCSQCGCVTKVKAFRTNDTCPVKHPEIPGINRWDELHYEPAENMNTSQG